ncbi:hypothetical protein [uncultured Xanthomonas sp.]|uniref:hypothetical protein n=1 Tax=uncultured Xanthomonas sp. TaxID=152831 RepID=UPI0025E97378|nr:hypothetical protein [uncultured Xanthomonas sp.]
MNSHSYLLDFFRSLKEEENNSIKKTFEGDFSKVGSFSILTEKYLENNEILFNEIIPKFAVDLGAGNEINDAILESQKEATKSEIGILYKNLEKCPGSFYENQISHYENKLLNLSMESLKKEANSIFDEVLSLTLQAHRASAYQTKENYFYTFCLKILFDRFKFEISNSEKYRTPAKIENKIYKYYKSFDVDLKESDRQFLKYDLLSIDEPEQIISGLPSRIFDKKNNSQFLIDISQIIIEVFAHLMSSKSIKNISFLVECEVVFQTAEKYFIVLGNEQPKSPLFLADFLCDTRDHQATKEVFKEEGAKNTFPPHKSAGRFFDRSNDSAWYFIDQNEIYFEEVLGNPEVLDDCVVTQLIHIEYFMRCGEILLSHIDHEYIFYSYNEFDKRQKDFRQKGSARKRIKTLKIDNSEIPLIAEGNVLVLNTILEHTFKKPYLFNGFFREIVGIANNSFKPTPKGAA